MAKTEVNEFDEFLEELYKPQEIVLDFKGHDYLFEKASSFKGLKQYFKNKKFTFQSKMHFLSFFYLYDLSKPDSTVKFKLDKFDEVFGKGKLQEIYAKYPGEFLSYIQFSIKSQRKKLMKKSEELGLSKLDVWNSVEFYTVEFIDDLIKEKSQDKETVELLEKTRLQLSQIMSEVCNSAKQSASEESKSIFSDIKATNNNKDKNTYFLKNNQGEYIQQMLAYAVGQSKDRKKEEKHVSKAYLKDDKGTGFLIQTAHSEFQNLSRYLIDVNKYESAKKNIMKNFGLSEEEAKNYIFSEVNKGIFQQSDINPLVKRVNSGSFDNFFLGSEVSHAILSNITYDMNQIGQIFNPEKINSGKIKTLDNEGNIVEAEIDYDSLAKVAMLIAVLNDEDGTGAHLTNIGAHIENGKMYFHKIDFEYTLSGKKIDKEVSIQDGKIKLNITTSSVKNGNKFAKALFSNIPQESLKKAAIDILSTAGEPLEKFMSQLSELNAVDQETFNDTKETLNSRLSQFQKIIEPILSEEDKKAIDEAHKKDLSFPANPIRDKGFLSTGIGTIRSRVVTFEKQPVDPKKKLETYKTKAVELQRNLSHVKADSTQKDAEIAKLKQELNDYQIKTQQIKTEIDQKEQKLETQIKDLKSMLDSGNKQLKEDLDLHQKNSQSRKEMLELKDQEIEKLKKKLDNAEKLLDKNQASITKIIESDIEFTKELKTKHEEELKKQKEGFEAKIKTLEESTNEKKQQITELKGKINQIIVDGTSTNTQNRLLREDKDELQQEVMKLELKLKQEKGDIKGEFDEKLKQKEKELEKEQENIEKQKTELEEKIKELNDSKEKLTKEKEEVDKNLQTQIETLEAKTKEYEERLKAEQEENKKSLEEKEKEKKDILTNRESIEKEKNSLDHKLKQVELDYEYIKGIEKLSAIIKEPLAKAIDKGLKYNLDIAMLLKDNKDIYNFDSNQIKCLNGIIKELEDHSINIVGWQHTKKDKAIMYGSIAATFALTCFMVSACVISKNAKLFAPIAEKIPSSRAFINSISGVGSACMNHYILFSILMCGIYAAVGKIIFDSNQNIKQSNSENINRIGKEFRDRSINSITHSIKI